MFFCKISSTIFQNFVNIFPNFVKFFLNTGPKFASEYFCTSSSNISELFLKFLSNFSEFQIFFLLFLRFINFILCLLNSFHFFFIFSSNFCLVFILETLKVSILFKSFLIKFRFFSYFTIISLKCCLRFFHVLKPSSYFSQTSLKFLGYYFPQFFFQIFSCFLHF